MRIVAPVAAGSHRRSPAKAGRKLLPIMGGASPLQQANPAEQRYARQPQTTAVTVQGGPFILHSRESETLQYQVTGIKFGNVVSQPLTPTAGFAKWLDVRVCASGGVLDSATTATLAADGPWSAI
ncbi:MAG: hypothetical protein L3K06_04380, partial [Thermoplasmata archaeon]|nr:hypothetical protein [Thermoplasmata archaeon]